MNFALLDLWFEEVCLLFGSGEVDERFYRLSSDIRDELRRQWKIRQSEREAGRYGTASEHRENMPLGWGGCDCLACLRFRRSAQASAHASRPETSRAADASVHQHRWDTFGSPAGSCPAQCLKCGAVKVSTSSGEVAYMQPSLDLTSVAHRCAGAAMDAEDREAIWDMAMQFHVGEIPRRTE